jgi:hypothetical protein
MHVNYFSQNLRQKSAQPVGLRALEDLLRRTRLDHLTVIRYLSAPGPVAAFARLVGSALALWTPGGAH